MQDRIPFWQDPGKRSMVYQLLALSGVALTVWYFYSNTISNLERQNIATGFGFLSQEAGFEISESIIEYWSDDSYLQALLAGVLNTLKIAFIGNILAVLIGTCMGVLSLSKNWLVKKLTQVYVEGLRNIPLLLQLFFWYALFTEVLPGVRQALNPLKGIYLSQRGLIVPVPAEHPVWNWVQVFFLLGVLSAILFWLFAGKYQNRTGLRLPVLRIGALLIVLLPVLTWLVGGAPLEMDWPEMGGFNFRGGHTFTPEFISLLLGLVLYTGTFIAEIVRAGILSVSKGQWEASLALGLSHNQTMGLIILPQALRVIIPPLTSQLLNLIKNSSLAVAIAYPDFVAVANTTMNQTGQAIELVTLIMTVYLFFSLSTSFFMNWYNKRIQLRER